MCSQSITGSYVYKRHPLSPGTLRGQLKSSGKRKFQGGVGIFWQKTGSVLELSCCRSVPRLGGYHSLWYEPVSDQTYLLLA